MTTSELPAQEIGRLSELFGELIDRATVRAPAVGEAEPRYTGAVIRPLVQTWLETLRRPALFLRADGGVAPLPVTTGGLWFYPDLEIAAHKHRYVALEVKFVRADYSASGAVTKALGQALLYKTCGIQFAHVLLIDLRGPRTPIVGVGDPAFERLPDIGITVHSLRPPRR